ncbi:MAG: fructosamine kinase family protein [Wenzhouxiangellaceae bacterium]
MAEQAIRQAGLSQEALDIQAATGGCIHHSFNVRSRRQQWFVKVATGDLAAAQLTAEADGLQALSQASGPRVPAVIAQAVIGGGHALILEYLSFNQQRAGAALGMALARLHHNHGAAFGWSLDNYLGATLQHNQWCDGIVTFMISQRLQPQLWLARDDGRPTKLIDSGQQLCASLEHFYRDYQPAPSLLHGDLWSGNQATLSDGAAVIFDPAVHYGDPEADLAMSELFGGFGPDFYAAYRDAHGIDDGYSVRRDLHQLYHVLNHCHLFGGAYVAQAQRLMERLLAEVKG